MVRPTLAISEDVLHVRTADVWMGWCPPNRLKRGGFLGLLLAPLRHVGAHVAFLLTPSAAGLIPSPAS
jgi:hypothetical protein